MIYTLIALIIIVLIMALLRWQAYEKKNLFVKHNIKVLSFGSVSLVVFIWLLWLMRVESVISNLDLLVLTSMQGLRNHFLNNLMLAVTGIGNVFSLAFLFCGILAGLIYKNSKGKGHFYYEFFSILAIGLICDFFIKHLIGRDRPFGGLILVWGESFPSGHTLMTAIFFFMLVYFFAEDIKNNFFRGIFIGISVFTTLLVGFSRLYLGVHWLSDVLAGLFLGIAVGCFSVAGISWMKKGG